MTCTGQRAAPPLLVLNLVAREKYLRYLYLPQTAYMGCGLLLIGRNVHRSPTQFNRDEILNIRAQNHCDQCARFGAGIMQEREIKGVYRYLSENDFEVII